MTSDQRTRNKHLVASFIQDLFTQGDLTAVDRYLADDFVNHDPPFPGSPDGADGLRQAAQAFRVGLPDWRTEVDHLIAEDDLVVEHFHAFGTHLGELFGQPGTGKTLTLRGIQIFRITDDRIVERWGRLDEAGLHAQLSHQRLGGSSEHSTRRATLSRSDRPPDRHAG